MSNCSICGKLLTTNTKTGMCHNCYSREYQRRKRAADRKAFNETHNRYYHDNKEKLSKYRQDFTKDHRRAVAYFAIYPDGLYIGSTYWDTQRRGNHFNTNGALELFEYEFPYDTPKQFLRLVEAFLIHKIKPAKNTYKMKSNISKSSISETLSAHTESDKIIMWAKSVQPLIPYINY